MAQRKNGAGNAPTTKKQPTAAEMRDWFAKNKGNLERYEEAKNALINLRDVSKSTKLKSIQVITKEELRTYLENPSNYESQLRNISWYLLTRSQVYYKLIKYNANMFCLNARSIIPQYSLTKENNPDKVLKSYEKTLKLLNQMGLQYEFLKVYTTCMIQDVFYGVVYFEENEKVTPSMFILPIPPEYCRIQGYWPNGTYAYVMDMGFFNRHKELLEFWGEPFVSLYREYESDNVRWKLMPQEYSVCMKFRVEDPETILPPFLGLFSALLGLIELEDLQDIAAEQEIYKLLVATIPTINGSENPDDFAVNPDLAVKYFNKLCDALPDFTDAVISPIPIEAINFNNDTVASDTNKVQTATKTVLNTSGGSQVLNSADISSSSGFKAAFKSDTEFAISSLLPQTEVWVNYFVGQYVSNPCKIKFFEVSTYTIEDFRKELLENGQHGLPTKLAIASMSGFSELDTLSLNYLEEDVLKLSDRFKNPLTTSYTQSDKQGGGQEKDIDDLSPEGEKTRDADKNGM
jgi:hypothetical protein